MIDINKLINRDCIKFSVCGSVDDGKSTFIGRLLFDSGNIFKDQINSLIPISRKRGFKDGDIDLSLLTDGLISEREQNITIDVAYRYFYTSKRKYIIIDTPGHEQYICNTVTGVSQSDLSLILIDATQGITQQTLRHAFIVSMLGIEHVGIIINKMDLVDFSSDIFEKIKNEFLQLSNHFPLKNITFFPVSSKNGDNVVFASKNMMWHNGMTVLDYLNSIDTMNINNLIDFRFPVQSVFNQNKRSYMGTIASGRISLGDSVSVLPGHHITHINKILYNGQDVTEAHYNMPVMISVEGDFDIDRGSMMAKVNNLPQKTQKIDAMILWMSSDTVRKHQSFIFKHLYKIYDSYCERVIYKINWHSGHSISCDELSYNDIGRIQIDLSQPIFYDSYERNKITGSFILISKDSNETVAGGIIMDRITEGNKNEKIPINIENRMQSLVSLPDRIAKNGHKPITILLTGLCGSGKSHIAFALEKYLFNNYSVFVLDGDLLRLSINSDLSFDEDSRTENMRRVGNLAKIINLNGGICICSIVAPYNAHRNIIKSIVGEENYFEIYVNTPLELCVERRKKLYDKAKNNEIINFPGINDTYETPLNPDMVVISENNVDDIVKQIIYSIEKRI